MIPAEITILRSLAEAEVVTFMPDGQTAAALARFEATLDSLREMQKASRVELKVAEEQKRRYARHRQTNRGAAARCTEAGREALRLLGEVSAVMAEGRCMQQASEAACPQLRVVPAGVTREFPLRGDRRKHRSDRLVLGRLEDLLELLARLTSSGTSRQRGIGVDG